MGVATAKAMAQALRVPTVGVSSLDLLAFPLRYSSRLIVPVIDARRGEVFYSFYRQVPGGAQRLAPYQLGTAEELASELLARGEECLVVGDGAVRYQDVLRRGRPASTASDIVNAYPSAASLVELAHPRAIREEFVPATDLLPLYLRKSDAEISWDRREVV